MIYIEYIERDRFMHFEIFRALGDQSWWAASDPDADDEMVAQLGRTLRLGPHPAYMTIWRCRGFDKLDEWEKYLGGDAFRADVRSVASHKAIHLCDAGCYDEVVTGPPIEAGLQYVEYFKPDEESSYQQLKEAHLNRAKIHQKGILNLVLWRIGFLGPYPGGIAIWTFPSYAALEGIVRDDEWQKRLQIVGAGVYRIWGQEIL